MLEVAKVIEVQSNLKYIESVSKQKIKKKRLLNLLNGLVIFLEIGTLIYLFHMIFDWHINKDITNNYLYLLGFILVVYFFQILNRGLFRLSSPYNWVSELFQLTRAAGLTFMITAGMLFILKSSYDYSRLVVGSYFASLLFTSWILRIIKRGILYWLSAKSILTKNLLIVGAGKVGQSLYDRLNAVKSKGYKIVGFLDDYKKNELVKGKLDEIEKVIIQNEIDEIIVTIPSERKYVYNLLRNIQKYKVNVKIIPELYDLVSTKVGFDQIEPYPFVEVGSVRMKGWHGLYKRLVDIALSSLGLVILTPLFVVLWCLIKINSPGPAMFKQKRIGMNGKPFYIYKFRSMVIDAEERLRSDPELYKKYIENNYKLEPDEDPRITRLGRFLRRTSLDELPQLINVLKGEMSIVGPRPVVHEELQEYDQLIFDFLSVKPGITGYWQVSGRSDAGYPERVDIELYYVYNQSLALDFKILLKTIVAVLKREGAY